MSEKVYIDLDKLTRFYNNFKSALVNPDNETISGIRTELNDIDTLLKTLNTFRCVTNDEIDAITNPPTGLDED